MLKIKLINVDKNCIIIVSVSKKSSTSNYCTWRKIVPEIKFFNF